MSQRMPTKMSKIDQFASYNDRQREKYSSERSWKRGSEMRGNGGTIVRSILRSLVLVVTLMSENANGYAPSISRSTTLIRSKRIERVRLFSSSPQTSSMPTSRSVPSKIDKAEKCGPVDPDRRALPFGLDSLIKMFTTEDEEYATFGLASSIPSDQPQLPVLERLAKAMHEESPPWLAAMTLPAVMSIALHSYLPFHVAGLAEGSFLGYCIGKLFYSFDRPTVPQPLIKSRKWEDLYDKVWASQHDMKSCQEFLMGWFYDAPFDSLRREDAMTYLAWMKHGKMMEHLTPDQRSRLADIELKELEIQTNSGNSLPTRQCDEEPLGCIRFNLEPLRFRHKPLMFYGITHGMFHFASALLKEKFGFQYVTAKNPKKDLGYWYRPPGSLASDKSSMTRPLVFVHGVGGLAFYFQLLSEIMASVMKDGDSTPMILLDLPHVSLRLCDDIPTMESQVNSICSILDETVGIGRNEPVKATFVGHSYGTVILSWMVQSCPERVANCIFMDPICFQLHLKKILYNFHMQRVDSRLDHQWSSPLSLGSLINLAGTEMHTNNAMLRHFWWASIALWPQDLVDRGVSASIILSENDEIVPSSDVERLVSEFNRKLESFTGAKMSERQMLPFVNVNVLEGALHGELALDEDHRQGVAQVCMGMLKDDSANHRW